MTPRQKDGRIRVVVTMPDGRRVWRSAKTPRDAERLRRGLVEQRDLDLDPSRQTLAGFLRGWVDGMKTARNARIKPRTLVHYEGIVERHIIPALGTLTLERVSPRRVQAWLDADPAAPRTVHHHHAVLRRALNIAVRQRLLAYNPAAHVELPRVNADHADPLTDDEALALLEATRGDWLGALWRLALATGLRQGELLGLAWEDVDSGLLGPGLPGVPEVRPPVGLRPEGGVGGGRMGQVRAAPASVTVRAQLQRLRPEQGGDVNGWALTSTKAARKLTRIAIDPDTAAELDEHRIRQAAARQPSWRYFGLVFVTEDGNPYHQSTLLKAFHEACDRAGIRRRRFHDLRGTSATLMRAAGVSEEARQARLGHATGQMAQLYAKASEAQDRLAADALGQVLGRTAG